MPPAAAPCQPIARIASFLRAGSWLPPAGRVVRVCGDVVRAGRISRREICSVEMENELA
ncbi:MAG: hypothetical protein PHN61_08270 [Methanothrix sp.]|nr:hypothetical protein [Methanothrix sp.]